MLFGLHRPPPDIADTHQLFADAPLGASMLATKVFLLAALASADAFKVTPATKPALKQPVLPEYALPSSLLPLS